MPSLPSPPSPATDQRGAVRFDTAMPVGLGDDQGTAHNISASGVSFESDLHQEVGSVVSVTLEYMQGGQRHALECRGRVVRVEPKGDRLTVAVSFDAPFFGDPEQVDVKAPAVRGR